MLGVSWKVSHDCHSFLISAIINHVFMSAPKRAVKNKHTKEKTISDDKATKAIY